MEMLHSVVGILRSGVWCTVVCGDSPQWCVGVLHSGVEHSGVWRSAKGVSAEAVTLQTLIAP